MNMNQYLYFGRARNLPGVKELLEEQKKQILNKYNSKIDKNIFNIMN